MTKIKAHSYLQHIEPYLPGDFLVEGVSPVTKLSSNESLLGPSPKVISAIANITGQLQQYPDSSCDEVREAIGKQYGINPQRIVCEAGSEPLINLLAKAYAGPGDEILFSQYGFIAYKIAAELVGYKPVAAPESDYRTDVDALLSCVTDKTKRGFLANPNNPTGTVISIDEIKRLRDGLADDILLVLDAAYAEYATEGQYSDGSELVNDEPGNVVVLRTFSKIYALASLRLGWVYAPDGICKMLNQLRGAFTVSSIAQIAGKAALKDTKHLKKTVEHNSKWRSWLTHAISKIGLQVFSSATNFLCVQFPNPRITEDADMALRKKGLIPRTLKEYGLPNCLRITIGREEHCHQVVKILSGLPEIDFK